MDGGNDVGPAAHLNLALASAVSVVVLYDISDYSSIVV